MLNLNWQGANCVSADTIPADPRSTHYFAALVDSVNRHVLAQLTSHIAGDAYVLAFVRGSMVQGRLEVARGLWARIVELLDIDEASSVIGALPGARSMGRRRYFSKGLPGTLAGS